MINDVTVDAVIEDIRKLNLKLHTIYHEVEVQDREYFKTMLTFLNEVLIIRRFDIIEEINEMLIDIGYIRKFSNFYEKVNGDITGSFFVEEKTGDFYFLSHDEFETFVDNVLSNIEDRDVILFNRYIMDKLYFKKGRFIVKRG